MMVDKIILHEKIFNSRIMCPCVLANASKHLKKMSPELNGLGNLAAGAQFCDHLNKRKMKNICATEGTISRIFGHFTHASLAIRVLSLFEANDNTRTQRVRGVGFLAIMLCWFEYGDLTICLSYLRAFICN